MKSLRIVSVLVFILLISGMKSITFAQSSPVMYFCERYDDQYGEVNITDRFTTGYLTVMVKSSHALGLKDCYIQFDKYNPDTRKFEYYKKFNYTIDPDSKYVFFSKNEDSDLKFSDPGFYRVFLLNDQNETVTSALIEIIP